MRRTQEEAVHPSLRDSYLDSLTPLTDARTSYILGYALRGASGCRRLFLQHPPHGHAIIPFVSFMLLPPSFLFIMRRRSPRSINSLTFGSNCLTCPQRGPD